MTTIEVRAPRLTLRDGVARSSCLIEIDGRAREAFLQTRADGPVSGEADAFLPGAMLAGMWRGATIRSEAPVSARLLEGCAAIQRRYNAWDARARLVPIEAPRRAAGPSGHGVGSFFSLGLDSAHTLLRLRKELSHIVLIHGFMPSWGGVAAQELSRLAREVAAEFAIGLIEVETNLREVLYPKFADWDLNHGSFLACVAHFLAPRFERVFIPGTYGPLRHAQNGSQADIDPLWSSEALAIRHDVSDLTRCQKAEQVAENDVLLQRLRVCMMGRVPGGNCGRCEKCVRTMVELRLAGALDRCRAFPTPLELGRVRYARPTQAARLFAIESLLEAEARNSDAELIAALRDCVSERPWTGLRWPLTAGRSLLWRLRDGRA